MNVSIENEYLKVGINKKGAELRSVLNNQTGLEYMWSGDPAFWAKTSPILFPIVGTLKKDTYIHNGKSYSLPRHGFARDLVFDVTEEKRSQVIFAITSTSATREKYPFDFQLQVRYALVGDMLEVTYNVQNTGKDAMYFSIGGHPAFKVPLTSGSTYEDYYLEFGAQEDSPRWPISADGLIKNNAVPFLNNTSRLKLTRDLFKEDALVFKNLKSDKVSIRSSVHEHGLDFYFEGFPYLGIWAAKNADFVCIEPWCGIADSVTHDQQLASKEGIEKLSPGTSWRRAWKVKSY